VRLERVLPPTYLLVAVVSTLALHFALSGPRVIGFPWRLTGIPIVLASAWLTLRADALFKRSGTEVKPFRPSKLVVMEGPYRFSRHPMYMGFMGILLGIAVLAGTLTPLLLVPAVFVLFNVRFAMPEERHMEEQFGEAYRSYKSRVRMWF
jgi:protein-S-isoprenylcysteine O-methyltransferase Ste14